ncbi:hypothetical protein K504DRAFT_384434, partial [Pleomassaria siparia CBS 279.74]
CKLPLSAPRTKISMDYLDELDNPAIQAFTELGRGIDFQLPSVTPTATINNTSPSSTHSVRHRRRVQFTYLFLLDDSPLTPQDIANILGFSRLPEVVIGSGEDGEAHFCRLSQSNVDSLDSWAAERYFPRTRFTKIQLGVAHKDSFELPILGRDPTLPQHRPSVSTSLVEKRICPEYPVYYFFYGTLASPPLLSRLFGIPESQLPPIKAASLLDGLIRIWAGKYWVLVDSPGGRVEGCVYPVLSVDQEDALRAYEGDSYEVVGARIVLDGTEIEGRTFRFAGAEDELSK